MIERLPQFVSESWAILLPTVLGFAGVYFLLPQVRRSRPALGALLGGIALVLTGWRLVAASGPVEESILFYAFAGIAILGGGLLVSQKNPVHSALSFALVVLATCGIFLLNAAPFLMAATIIVYAGAIVVTFLFVIMLAQQAGLAEADQRSREPFLASLAGFVLIGALLFVLHRTYENTELSELLAKVQQVAGAKSIEEIDALMGRRKDAERPALTAELSKFFHGEHAIPIDALDGAWMDRKPDRVCEKAQGVLVAAAALSTHSGGLTPKADLPLSRNSGVPANAPPEERAPLPANNVAGVGKSLFTDYLIPVELAAMLLLVATIGAIAIAGRHPEGLR